MYPCNKTRWGSKHTTRFVHLLKAHRCIWDTMMPENRHKEAKQQAYHAIAKAMKIPGVTSLDVRNKIKNLRSTYSQEKKKILKSREEGRTEYVPRLEWFDDFTEIISGVASEKTKNIKPELDNESDTDQEDGFSEKEETESEYVEVSRHYLPASTASPNQQSPLDQTSYTENEFEVFSRSVSAQLQRMPLKNALRMQLQIQTLLTEERIRLQEAGQYT